jgi:hypothetical protein
VGQNSGPAGLRRLEERTANHSLLFPQQGADSPCMIKARGWTLCDGLRRRHGTCCRQDATHGLPAGFRPAKSNPGPMPLHVTGMRRLHAKDPSTLSESTFATLPMLSIGSAAPQAEARRAPRAQSRGGKPQTTRDEPWTQWTEDKLRIAAGPGLLLFRSACSAASGNPSQHQPDDDEK